MLLKRTTFSLVLILFVAGNVFGQGLTLKKNDGGGIDPCDFPGEAILGNHLIHPEIDIRVQAPTSLGQQIFLSQLPIFYVNVYHEGQIIYSSGALPPYFNFVGPGCESSTNNSMGTYNLSFILDINYVLDLLDVECKEKSMENGQINVLLETTTFDGSFISYPVQNYPQYFYCSNIGGAITSKTLRYSICCIVEGISEDDSGSRSSLLDQGLKNMIIKPNPFQSNIEINSESAIEQVYIFDSNGKIVFTGKNSKFIDTHNWNSGVYLVKYFSGHEWNLQRIIKL